MATAHESAPPSMSPSRRELSASRVRYTIDVADVLKRVEAQGKAVPTTRLRRPADDAERATASARDASAAAERVLATPADWLRDVASEGKALTLVSSSYHAASAASTHVGLMAYLYNCWAAERGAVLRPDMVWHTILCELAAVVRGSPDLYRHLFSQTARGSPRPHIVIRSASASEMDAGRLAAAVRERMPEHRLADVVLGQSFPSAPPLAQYAFAAALCEMAAPFYYYGTSCCGIPTVDVVGTRDEWEQLLAAVEALMTFQPIAPPSPPAAGQGGASDRGDEWKARFAAETVEMHRDWLQRCARVVRDVRHWRFDSTDVGASAAFFSDIFHHGISYVCGSGHPDDFIYGWARDLYRNPGNSIRKFKPHVSAIPFRHIDTDQTFVQAVAMAYSVEEEHGMVWEPQYAVVTFESKQKARTDDDKSCGH